MTTDDDLATNVGAAAAYVRSAYAKLPQMTGEPFERPMRLTLGEKIAHADGHFSEVQAVPGGGYAIVRTTTDEQAAANVARFQVAVRELRPAAPVAQEPPAPHSATCSISRHDHGLTCVPSCPTCGGVDLPASGSAQEPADPPQDAVLIEQGARAMYEAVYRADPGSPYGPWEQYAGTPLQALVREGVAAALPILRAGIRAELIAEQVAAMKPGRSS